MKTFEFTEREMEILKDAVWRYMHQHQMNIQLGPYHEDAVDPAYVAMWKRNAEDSEELLKKL